MVTAKRAKWSPASSKKKNSTPSNRKLLSHSSAIPALSTALATSPSNTPSAPKPAPTAPASPNTPAPSQPSPTSSSTANLNFERGLFLVLPKEAQLQLLRSHLHYPTQQQAPVILSASDEDARRTSTSRVSIASPRTPNSIELSRTSALFPSMLI